jgi:hypothetical protein
MSDAHEITPREFSQKQDDLEGRQDMGGKHGGQAGMPKPEDRSSTQQGIVRDEKGQEQPADKERAQHVSRKGRGTIRLAIQSSEQNARARPQPRGGALGLGSPFHAPRGIRRVQTIPHHRGLFCIALFTF